ncbi:glycosyltransferase [Christiangramia sabulilitoris]|uniref:glycosyltransferase n=1 Tax=Christiangramia sabulilitoris TaxID=2583991 RepID=UPI001FB7AB99|nr:glycosyltransferase [Christiangramia sabulilitoris]
MKSITNSVLVVSKIFSEMHTTDHIHIRCPGNIGFLACLVQIFFPLKQKTVKYAGNWDLESRQPLSYKIQKWILSNTFLSRNIKVLIYGKWNNLNNNIIPFFTATYSEKEKAHVKKKFEMPYKFLFVGSIVDGKRPLLSLKIVHGLIKKGVDARLDIYGKGERDDQLSEYILKNDLQGVVTMHGNQDSVILKEAYKSSHFSILPSKSEGWPKALAEAMFFGCIPIATSVSCVPWMLNDEKRGILIEPQLDYAVPKISEFLENPDLLDSMSSRAMEWSQQYNIEKFKVEIQKLL